VEFGLRILLAQTETILKSLPATVTATGVDALVLDSVQFYAELADKQTGVVTSLEKLTAEHLSTLLNEVLDNSAYRDNARKLQKAIAKANGLSVAADLIEESLGVTA
jgi:hypothetical protein